MAKKVEDINEITQGNIIKVDFTLPTFRYTACLKVTKIDVKGTNIKFYGEGQLLGEKVSASFSTNALEENVAEVTEYSQIPEPPYSVFPKKLTTNDTIDIKKPFLLVVPETKEWVHTESFNTAPNLPSIINQVISEKSLDVYQ